MTHEQTNAMWLARWQGLRSSQLHASHPRIPGVMLTSSLLPESRGRSNANDGNYVLNCSAVVTAFLLIIRRPSLVRDRGPVHICDCVSSRTGAAGCG
jgi:hypothetical protein